MRVTAEKSEVARAIPGGGAVFRDRAFWNVDVNVFLLVKIGVGVVDLRPASNVRDGRPGRLLHHVAEGTGQGQRAFPLEEARFDRQDLSPDLGPGEARGHTDFGRLALLPVAEFRLPS